MSQVSFSNLSLSQSFRLGNRDNSATSTNQKLFQVHGQNHKNLLIPCGAHTHTHSPITSQQWRYSSLCTLTPIFDIPVTLSTNHGTCLKMPSTHCSHVTSNIHRMTSRAMAVMAGVVARTQNQHKFSSVSRCFHHFILTIQQNCLLQYQYVTP